MDRRETSETNLSVCCEVCAQEFSHEEGHIPKLLSCGHTYCETCLSKLQHRTGTRVYKNRFMPVQYEITCPKCKQRTVSYKPCSLLPKNYSYLELIEEVLVQNQKKKKCCKEHPNYVLDMFCNEGECGETICLYCADYGEHKGHNVSRLSGFSDQQRTSIRYRIDSLETIIENYGELSTALEEKEHELTDKVEKIRKYIVSRFESVQSEIKRTLDTKLEAVLNQLDDCCAVQLSLLQDARQSLDIQGFEDIQAKAKTFLSEADECTVAREKDLLTDMQAKIDETQFHTMCTKHVYEVQVNSADHIVQSVQDLVDAWVCCVKDTEVPSHEYVSAVIGRYFPSYGDSMNILFGEKLPCEQFTNKPFDMIDCN